MRPTLSTANRRVSRPNRRHRTERRKSRHASARSSSYASARSSSYASARSPALVPTPATLSRARTAREHGRAAAEPYPPNSSMLKLVL
jgi:hypothetical protein